MQRSTLAKYRPSSFKSTSPLGYFESWLLSFDAPMAADEAIDSLIYRERCGCYGDLHFHDVVWHGKLHYGDLHVCPKCEAMWFIGIA